MADGDTTEIELPNDQEAEVTVDTAAPAGDKTVAVQEQKPSDSAPEAVELLKKQLAEKTESEKAARDLAERNANAAAEAERFARQSQVAADESAKVAQSRELDSVVNALGAANRESESLEQKLAAAYEAGEFGTVAKLQGQLGKLGARIAQLEEGKTILEQRAKEKPPEPIARTDEERREAYLRSRTAPTAAWLRANPQFFSNPDFRRKVESADGYVANILGVSRDTPEYFHKIEETVGLRQAAATTASEVTERVSDTKPAPAKPAKAPATAAPPSRQVPSQRQEPSRVTLTSEEVAAAQWLFPKQKPTDPDPLVLYARHKQALDREGKLLGRDGRPMGPQV